MLEGVKQSFNSYKLNNKNDSVKKGAYSAAGTGFVVSSAIGAYNIHSARPNFERFAVPFIEGMKMHSRVFKNPIPEENVLLARAQKAYQSFGLENQKIDFYSTIRSSVKNTVLATVALGLAGAGIGYIVKTVKKHKSSK